MLAPTKEATVQACPSCGAAVTCGMTNGAATCWCFELPHAMPLSFAREAQCYCAACLRQLIERKRRAG